MADLGASHRLSAVLPRVLAHPQCVGLTSVLNPLAEPQCGVRSRAAHWLTRLSRAFKFNYKGNSRTRSFGRICGMVQPGKYFAAAEGLVRAFWVALYSLESPVLAAPGGGVGPCPAAAPCPCPATTRTPAQIEIRSHTSVSSKLGDASSKSNVSSRLGEAMSLEEWMGVDRAVVGRHAVRAAVSALTAHIPLLPPPDYPSHSDEATHDEPTHTTGEDESASGQQYHESDESASGQQTAAGGDETAAGQAAPNGPQGSRGPGPGGGGAAYPGSDGDDHEGHDWKGWDWVIPTEAELCMAFMPAIVQVSAGYPLPPKDLHKLSFGLNDGAEAAEAGANVAAAGEGAPSPAAQLDWSNAIESMQGSVSAAAAGRSAHVDWVTATVSIDLVTDLLLDISLKVSLPTHLLLHVSLVTHMLLNLVTDLPLDDVLAQGGAPLGGSLCPPLAS